MKYLISQIAFLVTDRTQRASLRALLKYLAFLAALVTTYAVVFHVIKAVLSLLHGHEPILVGEGIELFTIPVPPVLAGRPLRESAIGSRTGLSVVALRRADQLSVQLTAETVLAAGSELVVLGSREQRQRFAEAFERH